MLKCKCRVDVRNKDGFTPLHLAASAGAVDVCNRLLEGGAAVNDILIRREVKLLNTALDTMHVNGILFGDCVIVENFYANILGMFPIFCMDISHVNLSCNTKVVDLRSI